MGRSKSAVLLVILFLFVILSVSCGGESKGLREEIKMLKQENSFLKAENTALKKETEELYRKIEEKAGADTKVNTVPKVVSPEADKTKKVENSKVKR